MIEMDMELFLFEKAFKEMTGQLLFAECSINDWWYHQVQLSKLGSLISNFFKTSFGVRNTLFLLTNNLAQLSSSLGLYTKGGFESDETKPLYCIPGVVSEIPHAEELYESNLKTKVKCIEPIMATSIEETGEGGA